MNSIKLKNILAGLQIGEEILWLIDEDEDIIIRNSICFKKY